MHTKKDGIILSLFQPLQSIIYTLNYIKENFSKKESQWYLKCIYLFKMLISIQLS